MSMSSRAAVAASVMVASAACGGPGQDATTRESSPLQALVDQYATVRLSADLSHLTDADRRVVRLLIEAVQPMDDVFWFQAFGGREQAMTLAGGDEAARSRRTSTAPATWPGST